MYMKKESIFTNDIISLVLSKEIIGIVKGYTEDLIMKIKCNFDYGSKYFSCNIYKEIEEILFEFIDDTTTILKVVATIEYELKREFGKANVYCNKRLKIIPISGLLKILNSELVVRKNISPFLIQRNDEEFIRFMQQSNKL